MHATCLVCTLKRSPEPSNSEALAEVVLGALRDEGVTTDVIRLTDQRIDPGVISEVNGALCDIGYTAPGQDWTYWNKGPGPGEEERLTTQERDWSTTTGKACAQNLLAVARALQRSPIPAPPS
jgi:hypothetical protein